MEKDLQFQTCTLREGLGKTIIKCGGLGLAVAVGAFVVMRDIWLMG